jgi:S1-C subfamily serine protease
VRYVLINEKIKTDNKLSVDYGAWVKKDNSGDSAVLKDSPAEKAGIKEGDIILEIAGQKITQENTLSYFIGNYQVGEKASLKVLRDSQEITLEVVFEERPNNF